MCLQLYVLSHHSPTHTTHLHTHKHNTIIYTRTHNLLQILLDASQEDVEAMCLSFEISKKNCFGDLVNHELIPDGTHSEHI